LGSTRALGLKETILGDGGFLNQIMNLRDIYIQTKNLKEFVDWLWTLPEPRVRSRARCNHQFLLKQQNTLKSALLQKKILNDRRLSAKVSSMKIVVVDHVYLNKNHVKRLRTAGDLQIFQEPPRTSKELRTRIREADIVVVGWSQITRDVLEYVKKLRLISIWATSCHYVDLEAAREKGIVITHVPGYSTESVAEFTFGLMLAAIRKINLADKHVRRGQFDWRPFGGKELAGKTLGIIGTGAIGFRVAEIAQSFKMQLLGCAKHPNRKRAKEVGLRYVDLETLLKKSDVLTIHVTLTPETENLIGEEEIAMMKDGVVLVNTSQGKVVDEKALIEALKAGKIACAGLDVLEQEPPLKGNTLFTLENVVLSPHIGFNTAEAEKRCSDICVDNIVKFLEGKPQNLC